jgi:hypothetical protein
LNRPILNPPLFRSEGFSTLPQGAIEFYVLIDRFHFAGRGAAAVAVGVVSPSGQSAPDGIFLNLCEAPRYVENAAAVRPVRLSADFGST